MQAEAPSRTKMNCSYENAQKKHTLPDTRTHKHIYPVSLWTEWTSQTFLSSSQWGQPAWPLGVTNMQFTQPDSRGSSESVHSRTREREERTARDSCNTNYSTDRATMSRKFTKQVYRTYSNILLAKQTDCRIWAWTMLSHYSEIHLLHSLQV